MLKKILIIFGFSLGLAVMSDVVLYFWAVTAERVFTTHAYVALFLGVFFTCLCAAGLSMLAFVSARTGVDDAAHDVKDED